MQENYLTRLSCVTCVFYGGAFDTASIKYEDTRNPRNVGNYIATTHSGIPGNLNPTAAARPFVVPN